MTTQAEFIQANAIQGALTPEQAVQMMNLPEGDTSNPLETDGQPAATTDETKTETAAQAGDANEKPNVLLAKDGVHTIPYERLTEAREGERHWKAQAAAAATQIEALQAESAQRAATGQAPTATDNAAAVASAAINSGEVSPEIFGDFSEEALAKGVETLVDARIEARVNEAMAKFEKQLQPFQAQQSQSATEQHYGAIYAKHPDADSIAESTELAGWIDKQPSFARAGFQATLQKGSASEIIELFDAFKQATESTHAAKPSKDGIAAAAQAAIAKAVAAAPTSLTDFPGGTAGPGSKFEAMDAMSGPAINEAMQSMNPEQIEAYLNRQF